MGRRRTVSPRSSPRPAPVRRLPRTPRCRRRRSVFAPRESPPLCETPPASTTRREARGRTPGWPPTPPAPRSSPPPSPASRLSSPATPRSPHPAQATAGCSTTAVSPILGRSPAVPASVRQPLPLLPQAVAHTGLPPCVRNLPAASAEAQEGQIAPAEDSHQTSHRWPKPSFPPSPCPCHSQQK